MTAVPAAGAMMNIRWNRNTPRKALLMEAFSTEAPPTSSAAMLKVPIWVCAL